MDHKFSGDAAPSIESIDSLADFRARGTSLRHCAIVGLDFSDQSIDWTNSDLDETTLFLGCQLDLETEIALRRRGANVLQAPGDLPYRPFRRELYSWQELMAGYSEADDQSTDLRIYRHFAASRYRPAVDEALWQRIHDFAIDEQLRHLLRFNAQGMTERRVVGFMGGHSMRRDAADYVRAVRTAKQLSEAGYFIASGGGPGIMEAANLGAYLAGREERELEWVLTTLARAPHYTSPGYNAAALDVLDRIPTGKDSLAIPTWFYGHEPSNLFASHIAKYFSNSIREDTLLAVSLYGIVFAPGSAGTTQEIFMDAAQNHYATFRYVSPMVFLGRRRYEVETLLYPLLRQLAHDRPYYDYLFLTDEPAAVVDFLQAHPPIALDA
jgi:predicted Rossmann-fold nucleotide-binding protein